LTRSLDFDRLVSFYDFATKEAKVSAKFTEREVGDVTIVDVEGRVTLGEGSAGLRDQIKSLAARGRKKVILNLHDTMYFDSSGVGELVSGFTTLSNCGAQLKLLKLTKLLEDLLQITKLYTIFEVYDDEAKAVASFNTYGWWSKSNIDRY
jgi:anti-sigma B factor antagonist